MTEPVITYTKGPVEENGQGASEIKVTIGNPLEMSLRKEGLIKNCVEYADGEPCGLPGHQLMLLVAKLAKRCGLA